MGRMSANDQSGNVGIRRTAGFPRPPYELNLKFQGSNAASCSSLAARGYRSIQFAEIALGLKRICLGALDQGVDEHTGIRPSGAAGKNPVLAA